MPDGLQTGGSNVVSGSPDDGERQEMRVHGSRLTKEEVVKVESLVKDGGDGRASVASITTGGGGKGSRGTKGCRVEADKRVREEADGGAP